MGKSYRQEDVVEEPEEDLGEEEQVGDDQGGQFEPLAGAEDGVHLRGGDL